MSRQPKRFVSGGFLLLLAWFAWANGVALLVTVLLAALAHEGGHALALHLVGGQLLSFRWTVFGAEMTVRQDRLSYGQELLVTLAGPLTNLLCGLGLAAMGGRWFPLAGANLILCGFNLLPVRPLDGGRVLELAVSCFANPAVGDTAVRWTGRITILLLAALLGTVMVRTGGSLWLLLPLLGLVAENGKG